MLTNRLKHMCEHLYFVMTIDSCLASKLQPYFDEKTSANNICQILDMPFYELMNKYLVCHPKNAGGDP